MTLEEFSLVIATRIPTPAEFVGFVEGMGWRITTDGAKASLRASKGDRLAIGLARMLGREPYRTAVLALAMERWRQEQQTEQETEPPVAEPPARIESAPETAIADDRPCAALCDCRACRPWIYEPAKLQEESSC